MEYKQNKYMVLDLRGEEDRETEKGSGRRIDLKPSRKWHRLEDITGNR